MYLLLYVASASAFISIFLWKFLYLRFAKVVNYYQQMHRIDIIRCQELIEINASILKNIDPTRFNAGHAKMQKKWSKRRDCHMPSFMRSEFVHPRSCAFCNTKELTRNKIGTLKLCSNCHMINKHT